MGPGKPEALLSALEKLAATNLAEKEHPWLYEILFSSHPSLAKRKRDLEGVKVTTPGPAA